MADNDDELDAADVADAADEAELAAERDAEDLDDAAPANITDGIDVASARIRQQAIPYYVVMEVPREPFDIRARQYFRQHRAELEQRVREIPHDPSRTPRERTAAAKASRAYRRGHLPQGLVEQLLGRLKTYWPMWYGLMEREVQRQHQDREVLLFQDVDLQDSDPVNYCIISYFFFVPAVTLPDLMEQPLPEIEVVVRTDDEIAAQVERKIAASLVPVLTTEKAEPCGPGDGVVASIVVTRGNRKVEHLDIRNQTFFTELPDQMIQQAPPDAFLGLAAGEHAVRTLPLPVQPGESIEPSEEVPMADLHVHVHAVYGTRISTAEEQAQARGFASADDWRARLTEGYRVVRENSKKSAVRQQVEQHLRAISDVAAVPSTWLTNKISDAYGQLLRQHGSERQALTAYHAADKDELMNALSVRLLLDLERTLLIREWGRRMGVEGDSTFDNAVHYVEAVWAWAELNVPVNEITTAMIEERSARAQQP